MPRESAEPPWLHRVGEPITFDNCMCVIFIKPRKGKTIRLENVLVTDTVERVKAMITTEIGVQADQQRLVYAGGHISDAQTLSDNNIRNESTLRLVLK